MNDLLSSLGTPLPDVVETRKRMQQEVYHSLGGGMIDLELEPEHYDLAMNKALETYRTRSTNAFHESFLFLEVQPETIAYTLPSEVIDIRRVFRRGVGTATGSGAQLDPFSAALVTNLYSVQAGTAGQGSVVTYELAMQYQELINRLFGLDILFTWDKFTKKISFQRRFTGRETILVWAYMYRPENVLMGEFSSKQWIRRWAIAECKLMLGNARSTYAQYAGPGGGTSLNGDQLKSEADAEFTQLRLEAFNQEEGGDQGYSFIIG